MTGAGQGGVGGGGGGVENSVRDAKKGTMELARKATKKSFSLID